MAKTKKDIHLDKKICEVFNSCNVTVLSNVPITLICCSHPPVENSQAATKSLSQY